MAASSIEQKIRTMAGDRPRLVQKLAELFLEDVDQLTVYLQSESMELLDKMDARLVAAIERLGGYGIVIPLRDFFDIRRDIALPYINSGRVDKLKQQLRKLIEEESTSTEPCCEAS